MFRGEGFNTTKGSQERTLIKVILSKDLKRNVGIASHMAICGESILGRRKGGGAWAWRQEGT